MSKKSPSKPIISNSSKSKKSATKERDKKKINFTEEPSSSNNTCSSIERMHLTSSSEKDKKYYGFGPDTIQYIAEQFNNERVSEKICTNLAEDVTYKVREILQVACVNMRHGKRKHLKVDDLNATFKKFNLERVYGPAMPNWKTFNDPDNLFCIPETTVDLLDLATSESSFTEPGSVGIDYKWINDTSLFNQLLVSNSFNNYSQIIMKAAVSTNETVRKLALKDIATNKNIGPIISELCNFCFLILQKNVTYSSLAIPTMQLLEAIMFNPCTSYSVEEKQMTLLIHLLVENVINATNDMLDDVKPICRTLGRLCLRWIRGSQVVIEKITKYLKVEEPVHRLSAPLIYALTYIGNEALNTLLWPHVDEIFKCLHHIETIDCIQLHAAILSAASLMYKSDEWPANNALINEFGDQLVPIWRLETKTIEQTTEDSKQNWINIKKILLKSIKIHSQQQISFRSSRFKLFFRNAKPISNNFILFIGYKTLPVNRRFLTFVQDPSIHRLGIDSVNIITGKKTLFTLKKTFSNQNSRCKKNIRDMMMYI